MSVHTTFPKLAVTAFTTALDNATTLTDVSDNCIRDILVANGWATRTWMRTRLDMTPLGLAEYHRVTGTEPRLYNVQGMDGGALRIFCSPRGLFEAEAEASRMFNRGNDDTEYTVHPAGPHD